MPCTYYYILYLFICDDIVHLRDISEYTHNAWYHNARTFLPSRMTPPPRADGCVYIADRRYV